MLMPFVSTILLIALTFFPECEGISSRGGVYGKKRDGLPSVETTPPNRFLCPGCTERKKEFIKTTNSQITTEDGKVKIHCMKGDKGDIGPPGPQGQEGTCKREQIEDVVKPLQAKIDALFSSYTKEIARLRNEVHSLKSKFVHTVGSEQNPGKSCREIYEQEKYSPSGTYYLNVTGMPGGVTRVYCYMEDDETCPAGSTLVLKMDGTKDTFKYSSPLWSNKEVYAEENGVTLFDSKETKLATYWSMPFTKVCINMRRLDSLEVESLVIDESSTSLYDILADGKYRATKGGRNIWKSLLPGTQLQNGCYREGFNAHGTQVKSAAARIGVIAGDKSNCTSPDSFIGFGTEGGSCASRRRISCGNEVGVCNTDADKYTSTFGYIFVY